MRAWYVARTKPRVERQTAVVLEQRGLEAYFPLLPPRRKRGLSARPEPLFPGYLFTRLDVETPDWLMARSAPGIAYFLGAGQREIPTTVPDWLVEEIRARIARWDYKRTEPSFHHGDRVLISGGPFEGLEAIFDVTLSPAGRSRVLVAIVGGLVRVSIDAAELRSVTTTQSETPTSLHGTGADLSIESQTARMDLPAESRHKPWSSQQKRSATELLASRHRASLSVHGSGEEGEAR
jgi:transcriptional antiterminator RfaH